MPRTPEEPRSQLKKEQAPSETLRNLERWLTEKGIPKEHASLTTKLIENFYSRHPIPTIDGLAHVGFGGKTTEFGGLYLWAYNFWPTAQDYADIEAMEQMNALTISFSKEISRPLRPHLSVRPKFLLLRDASAANSAENVLQEGCKKTRIECIGMYQAK